jgi:hypothetical protein
MRDVQALDVNRESSAAISGRKSPTTVNCLRFLLVSIATRSYEATGIRIGLGCMVFGMPLLELVCIPILYS